MRRFIGRNHLTGRLPIAGSYAINFLTQHNISRFSATEGERAKAKFSNHRLNDFMFSMMVLSASAIMIAVNNIPTRTDREKINYDAMSVDELVLEINKIPGFEKFSARDIFTYGPDGWSNDDNRCYDRNSYAAEMREILERSEAYRAFSEKYNEQLQTNISGVTSMTRQTLFNPQDQTQLLRQKEQRLSELRGELIYLSYYLNDISNEEIAYSDARVSVARDGTDWDDIHDAHFEFRRLFIELHGTPELKEQVQKVDNSWKAFVNLRNGVIASREVTESVVTELKENQGVTTAHTAYHDESFRFLDLMAQERERSTAASAMRPN